MSCLTPLLRSLATPVGAAVTLYALNIVAWGGMIFLLLINAAPAMCRPSCTATDSPRAVWIEIDAQILNALFCVTGFGLAPWRARDLFWWAVWRCGAPVPCVCRRGACAGYRLGWATRWWRGDSYCGGGGGGGGSDDDNDGGDGEDDTGAGGNEGLRRLALIHSAWIRLPPSEDDAAAADLERKVPTGGAEDAVLPTRLAEPTPPRASPTPRWKIDFVVWTAVLNTAFQTALAGIMWGLDRFNRPSWATGLLVVLACVVGAASGAMIYFEQQRVKKVEGATEAVPAAMELGEVVKV
jgi:hypothetical protein